MPDLGGGDEAGMAETTPPEAPEEDTGPKSLDQLAAAPAKRRDNGYEPVAADGRKYSHNKEFRQMAVPESGLRTTPRTLTPGLSNLSNLAKFNENILLDDNENKLHEVNSQIKNLLSSLENMDAKIRKTKV